MISQHVTYKEATFSATAVKRGILNEPDESQLENIVILVNEVFEPLRAGLGGKPIRITSLFRSKELNRIIGGALSSQHLCHEGAAMDLDNVDPSNMQIFNYIKNNLEFDQLIWEYEDLDGNPSWVHVSYHEGKNRKQILRCVNGHYYNYESAN